MPEIFPQISNPLTSCSEFTGQNYPLREQGFRHEGRELIDQSDFKLQSVIRDRSPQSPIFEFPFV